MVKDLCLSLLAIPSTKFNRPVVCVMEEVFAFSFGYSRLEVLEGSMKRGFFLCTVGLRLYAYV